MAGQPLHELGPAGPGAEAAALGFAWALAASWAGPAGVFWAGEEAAFAEEGAPYPPGLAQFGLDPEPADRRARTQARRSAVGGRAGARRAGAIVICALGAHGKPLDLKASAAFAAVRGTQPLALLAAAPADGRERGVDALARRARAKRVRRSANSAPPLSRRTHAQPRRPRGRALHSRMERP